VLESLNFFDCGNNNVNDLQNSIIGELADDLEYSSADAFLIGAVPLLTNWFGTHESSHPTTSLCSSTTFKISNLSIFKLLDILYRDIPQKRSWWSLVLC
jgi:hypothetical protein